MMNAQRVMDLLGLTPLVFEGGFFRQTYYSRIPLPGSSRVAMSAMYYLITPNSFSHLHRLASDEIFHFYAGDAVEMLQITPDGQPARVVLGNQFENDQLPQAIVPAGTWQGAKLMRGGNWALLGTTVSPGYVNEDFELADRAALSARYPELAVTIKEFTWES